jgi:phosphotriesterase-related protein
MTRREFLALAPAAAMGATALPGSVLVHEHVMVDFIGADKIAPGRYDSEEVFRSARPKLEAVKALGCVRLQECTPNFLGRDARLMRRLSDAVGIDIWTNTGLYGAASHKYLPQFAWDESAEKLARRWEEEWRRGVDGVKLRFIKIGVNKGPLHELDKKIVRAAALAAKETGLTVASHTGDGAAAMEELEIFTSLGAMAGKFVWVHAQNEKDHEIHQRFAMAGGWVEFDGIGPKSMDWHAECIRFMSGAGLLGRTLVSQDAGWYHVGEPGGGTYRGYELIYTGFLPRFDAAERKQLMVDNPRAAFGS